MTLYQELNIATPTLFAHADRFDEQIGESRLHARMEVNLGLLEDDRRVRRNVKALHNDRKHLRNPETDVSQVDSVFATGGAHQDFVLFAVRGQRLRLEVLDQAHLLEPTGNDFLKGLTRGV